MIKLRKKKKNQPSFRQRHKLALIIKKKKMLKYYDKND